MCTVNNICYEFIFKAIFYAMKSFVLEPEIPCGGRKSLEESPWVAGLCF